MMIDIETIRATVGALDAGIDPHCEEFEAAVVLLSSTRVGPSAVRVAEFSGIPLTRVRGYAREYRKSGIWSGHKIVPSDWHDEETGGTAFWMDVACGMGLLQRA